MELLKEDIEDFCNAVTCPICLDFFHRPCDDCWMWAQLLPSLPDPELGIEEDRDASCPQCKEAVPDRSFVSNQMLVNFVEIMKKVNLKQERREEDEKGVCDNHQEPLKLFRKDHEAPICLACDNSKEHKGQNVVFRRRPYRSTR